MKAIVHHEYGSPDVLKLATVKKPVPDENEVLIKIHAAALNAADWHLMRASPFLVRLMFGFFKPRFPILGADVAGVVEAVGSNVTLFKPGDEVFGDTFAHKFGGFAEYVCMTEEAIVHKPANVSFQVAAAVPLAGVTALQALRDKGQIRKGQKVLINGASGGVGTFAVQLAKHFGAEVTAVCSNSKIDMVRSIGADHVIDYATENFTQNGKRYDLIIAANGYHPITAYKRVLNPNGIYVMVGGAGWQMFQAVVAGPFVSMGKKKMSNLSAKPNQDDLFYLKNLLEQGVIKPVIDRTYTLEEIPDAMRYLEEGHAKGKIVIEIK
jgi:NADPH:quinone reductase-like Zn-dependent oxidoreductase